MKLKDRQEVSQLDHVDGLHVNAIIKAIKSIHYGEVRIIVQNSNVVQIDKTEKTRLSQ